MNIIQVEPRFLTSILMNGTHHICFPYKGALMIAFPNIRSKSDVNSLMKFIRVKSTLDDTKESRTHKVSFLKNDLTIKEFEDTYFELVPDSNIEKPY